MATVINNPDSGGGDGGGGSGFVIGAIILVIVLILFFIYGLPALRNGGDSGSNSSGSAEINVPEQVDVDVSTPNN
jgi:flagellar biogenesis protein FliO